MGRFWAVVLIFFLFFSCQPHNSKPQKLALKTGWKFINKDNLEFARPDFDDSAWDSIGVDKTWNKQGYPRYEGFAWYRLKVVIPSSLKKNAALKDSLIFHLGKIDDFDQVFLNGALIGQNCRNMPAGSKADDAFKDLNTSYWDVERRYSLPTNDPRIKWDQPNVLAIRVYDWGVAGGIYSGDLYLAMPQRHEYLRFAFERNRFDFNNGQALKLLTLRNTAARYSVSGNLSVTVKDNLNGKVVLQKEWTVHLKPRGKQTFEFSFPRPKQSTSAMYRLTLKNEAWTLQEQEGVPYILTPPAKPEPQINGARVYGERVGKPFLFRIPATGKRPMTFSAEGLPPGLKLNAQTGIISGKVTRKGVYDVRITARNALGKDRKHLRIVIGDQIALTPPLGWNSWNVWGLSVTQKRVYAAAKAFVEKGLADHGWMYINIDDGWEIYGKSDEPKRKPNGEIRTNEKFPDMKKLGDAIHALGLKFGIYSSPGPLTCGGYTASYGHEFQDARTFARWGVDYLKYDLCSYRQMMKDQNDPGELIPPYQKMHRALQKVNRDIVYSLCEYGNGKVWEWGARVGGNLWRTTGDIWDDWERMASIGFHQEQAAPYAGPGHWNDPDMLVVGWVGWGDHLHYTNLTPDEQYTHVSLWALLSAPLLIGCDLQRLDDFTLNLLTNDEVLAIDQDALGKQAVPVIKEGDIQVYRKELSDGNWAVGVFNLGDTTKTFVLSFERLGMPARVRLRDVWRQKDLGEFEKRFDTVLPAHGVTLVKVFAK
jgi:hypothetical protein